jgi:hypothetical protein
VPHDGRGWICCIGEIVSNLLWVNGFGGKNNQSSSLISCERRDTREKEVLKRTFGYIMQDEVDAYRNF